MSGSFSLQHFEPQLWEGIWVEAVEAVEPRRFAKLFEAECVEGRLRKIIMSGVWRRGGEPSLVGWSDRRTLEVVELCPVPGT